VTLSLDVVVRRGRFVVTAAFDAADGETLAILGPNGAGKTTLLGAIAGVLPLERGRVGIDGRAVEALPPEERGVGVAFQDGLLFPTMTSLENVAFPLRARGTGRGRARDEARRLLADVAPDVDPAAAPATLSGGEARRVSLARALASRPRALLLDEPLAAVDVAARVDVRAVVRRVASAFGGVCVLVAHDPVDALTLADRIVLVEGGRVTQVGTPDELRDAPATRYAADLVGVNLFRGRLEPLDGGTARLVTPAGDVVVAAPERPHDLDLDDVVATLAPADVALHLARPEGSPRNVLDGPVSEIAVVGDRARVRIDAHPPLVAEVTTGSVARLGLRAGVHVFASFKAVEVRLRIPGAATLDA